MPSGRQMERLNKRSDVFCVIGWSSLAEWPILFDLLFDYFSRCYLITNDKCSWYKQSCAIL